MAAVKTRYKSKDETIDEFVAYFERLCIANVWEDAKGGQIFPSLLESDSRFHSIIDSLATTRKFSEIKAAILKEEEPYRDANCSKLLNSKMAPTIVQNNTEIG